MKINREGLLYLLFLACWENYIKIAERLCIWDAKNGVLWVIEPQCGSETAFVVPPTTIAW